MAGVRPDDRGAFDARGVAAGECVWPPRIALALFCLVLSIGAIFGRSITYLDETRVAGIAREMELEREYALPRLNGEAYLEYPSAGYLPLVGVMRLGGASSDFLVLLPSALAGLVTILLTYWMGRTMGGERAGIASALVLQCTFGFLTLHTRVAVDPLLLLWISASLCGFLSALAEPPRWGRHLALFHFGMGAGFLTKGLVGAAIPAAVAGAFLVVTRRWRELPRLFLHGSVAFLILPVAFWYHGVGVAGGEDALAQVWRQSLWRFFSPSADHASPPYFYLDRLIYLLAPASALLPWLLWDALAPTARRVVHRDGPLDAFPLVWFLVGLVSLSLASAKRNIYLAPIYPAFALMVGTWWVRARAQAPALRPWRWLKSAVPGAAGRALVLSAYAAAVLGYMVVVEHPRSERHDARPLFQDAARHRREVGARLVLVNPRESIRGAAVHYLGETVPVARSRRWFAPVGPKGGPYLLLGEERFVEPMIDALAVSRVERLARHDLAGDIYRIALVDGRRDGGARVSAE